MESAPRKKKHSTFSFTEGWGLGEFTALELEGLGLRMEESSGTLFPIWIYLGE